MYAPYRIPPWAASDTFAPYCNRSLAISRCPREQASCKAVYPALSRHDGGTSSFSRQYATQS